MEHVEGKPLSELIPSDGLPPESVIRYGTQIADALAHAHEHGIVHRDLKSANVVITPEAQVKLIDFGIAVPLTSTDGDAVTRTMESPVSSAPVGTLAYMAPEVLSGQEATAPSDIWSLGVLLYEMAGGTPPFTGTTQTDVVSAIVKDSPAPLPTKVSPGLRNVIQHCLIKEPARRYPHPSAIQAALAAIQSDATVPRPVGVGPPGGTWMRPVVGAVIVLVVVAGLIVSVLRRSSPETSGSEVPRLTNPVQVTSAAGQESSPRWSPDGRMLAYSSRQNGNWDIWLAALGGEDPVNRTGDHLGRDDSPSWSPDGQLIAYLSYRDNGPPSVFGVSPLGGEARKLGAFSDPLAGLQWLSGGGGNSPRRFAVGSLRS